MTQVYASVIVEFKLYHNRNLRLALPPEVVHQLSWASVVGVKILASLNGNVTKDGYVSDMTKNVLFHTGNAVRSLCLCNSSLPACVCLSNHCAADIIVIFRNESECQTPEIYTHTLRMHGPERRPCSDRAFCVQY